VSLPVLRQVFFAGEPLSEALVHRWRAVFGDKAQIVNLYGPTETTLIKCYYLVPPKPRFGVQPVGRPIPQTQVLVLTDDDRLCGISEPGEIVLRTPFRTLGYINAAEENQRCFLRNPYRDDDNDLQYRTGDGGRYLPDGTLEILGRLDDQVKIRGVRVEPDEVTATLAQHPEVRACAVIAREDKPGEFYLAAYTVASGNQRLSALELRDYLAQRLPPALVPSAFVFLTELPLTPNGKLDRSALPTPERARADLDSSFTAPRDQSEAQLAAIWEEVLDTEPIGVHDNFFQLGGDSLGAMRVMAHVRQSFGLQLPERTIFETPTVAGMASAVAQAQKTDARSQAPAIAALPRKSRQAAIPATGKMEVQTESETEL
jgi:acyl carrier protein